MEQPIVYEAIAVKNNQAEYGLATAQTKLDKNTASMYWWGTVMVLGFVADIAIAYFLASGLNVGSRTSEDQSAIEMLTRLFSASMLMLATFGITFAKLKMDSHWKYVIFNMVMFAVLMTMGAVYFDSVIGQAIYGFLSTSTGWNTDPTGGQWDWAKFATIVLMAMVLFGISLAVATSVKAIAVLRRKNETLTAESLKLRRFTSLYKDFQQSIKKLDELKVQAEAFNDLDAIQARFKNALSKAASQYIADVDANTKAPQANVLAMTPSQMGLHDNQATLLQAKRDHLIQTIEQHMLPANVDRLIAPYVKPYYN